MGKDAYVETDLCPLSVLRANHHISSCHLGTLPAEGGSSGSRMVMTGMYEAASHIAERGAAVPRHAPATGSHAAVHTVVDDGPRCVLTLLLSYTGISRCETSVGHV